MDISKMMGLKAEVPQIKLRPLDSLIAYARNSRTHSASQVETLQQLLLEYGWTNAVLIDEHGIIAGHGRCMAAALIYQRGEQIKFPNGSPIPIGMIPTIDCTGWSEAQRRAYVIADNQSALTAGWDESVLGEELRWLDDAGFDLSLTAFNDDQLAELMAVEVEIETEADPNAVPELPEQPASVAGDVWVLGPHRVMCGDSTCPHAWDRLMQGERADACFTDPPYNADLGFKHQRMDKALNQTGRSANGKIKNDKLSDDDFAELLAGAFVNLFTVLKPGAVTYVAHADKVGDVFRREFDAAGFHFSQMLIWNKGQHVLGMADFQPAHEPILYGWKKGSKHKWFGGRKQRTVLDSGEGSPFTQLDDGRWCVRVGDQTLIVSGEATYQALPNSVIFEPKPRASGLHPSTKPVALIERLLRNNVRAGDLVVDAFGGSGSTLIAADRTGMSARLMELDPKYVDVICQRYWEYTGRRPVHAVTGELFPAAGEARQAAESGDTDSVF